MTRCNRQDFILMIALQILQHDSRNQKIILAHPSRLGAMAVVTLQLRLPNPTLPSSITHLLVHLPSFLDRPEINFEKSIYLGAAIAPWRHGGGYITTPVAQPHAAFVNHAFTCSPAIFFGSTRNKF
jgi:hypothetical protein